MADDGHTAAHDAPGPEGRPTPTASQRDIAGFFALCLVEAARYGHDSSIWIRELAQNARDADAAEVCFAVEGDDILVEDDGVGMTRDVVTGTLLRLFSSSKGSDARASPTSASRAAGCFGVGFWSVLLAGPARVEIDTVSGNDGVGVVIDVDGAAVFERPCRRHRAGTTVRLVAPRGGLSPAQLLARVRHHASMIQGLRGPIAVKVGAGAEGVIVNEAYSLAGLEGVIASVAIKGEGFSGFVGLSAQPHVELTHHGLRVVEATSLAALVPSLRGTPRRGLGLVARVDVPGLRVLVDRRTVVEDETIARLVRACEGASSKLERGLLDAGAPLPWHLRVVDIVGRALRTRAGVFAAMAVACVVVGFVLGSVVLSIAKPGWWSSERRVQASLPQTLSDAQRGMGPPRIDVRGQGGGGFSIVTRSVHDDLIIDVRRIPDAQEGLKETPHRATLVTPAPRVRAPVRASAQLLASGPTILPSSLVLWPIRAQDEERSLPIYLTPDGLPIVDAGPLPRRVDVYFAVTSFPPPATSPPPITPTSPMLEAIVAAARGRRDEVGVADVARAVAARVAYAASPDDAERFAADGRPFLDKVAALGIGDCDVLNTVVVLALQRAGFEARLARGLVVRDDRVASELHAWAEVYVRGSWLRVDVSPLFAVPSPRGARPRGADPSADADVDAPAKGNDQGAPTAFAPPIPSSPSLETTRADAAVDGLPSSAADVDDKALPPRAPPRPRGSAPHDALRAPLLAVISIAAGLAIALGWSLRRRRRAGGAVDDDGLTAIIVAGLRSGAGEHLGLTARPVIPTSQGPKSLHALRRLSARGRLATSGFSAGGLSLSPQVVLIDIEHPRVKALRAWLPPIVDDRAFSCPALGPHSLRTLETLQARVDGVFTTVALHPSGTRGIAEHLLCTADGHTHHISVGVDVLERSPAQAWHQLMAASTTLWAMRRRVVRGHGHRPLDADRTFDDNVGTTANDTLDDGDANEGNGDDGDDGGDGRHGASTRGTLR